MTQSKPTTSEVVMMYQLQRLEQRQETDQALLNLLDRLTPSEIIDQFKLKRQERMEKRVVEMVELRKRLEHLLDRDTGQLGQLEHHE
ncbi:hypothetical protein DFQ01_10633 [Paenibacillus cellulosilyticus]|uniref:Uncharacterized protein n=1 Tax=Paenibacillus cellulosilyticus TaxID=375489 RepID=A0A2V2YYE9_9BACL|nr:hypothetical protein [Paenibacillus cellulosilyticus]PWW04752.1 hypothetical protein DFQ01_10633 [Paenibacillus cellulosilyticus]QKS45877.1 hypothetical protein HUB94_16570 [Paenibacillus cellulosilyticus]